MKVKYPEKSEKTLYNFFSCWCNPRNLLIKTILKVIHFGHCDAIVTTIMCRFGQNSHINLYCKLHLYNTLLRYCPLSPAKLCCFTCLNFSSVPSKRLARQPDHFSHVQKRTVSLLQKMAIDDYQLNSNLCFQYLYLYLLNYRPWALHAIKFLCVRAMRDFVTYYCCW